MKKNKKTSLLLGSLITLIICISPYLLYIHNNIPDDLTEIETFLGTIKGGYYQLAQTYVYFFFSKFVPLFLLIIWFITNKHWWVHAILIPISVYLFQLISVIYDSEEFLDEIEFIYTIPILVIIILILYYLRSKLSIYIQAVDLKKEMDETMGSDF
ncbi:hypothetical protein R3X25_08195 [Lutibacter sp. TH_r2]|uniref:hypothetical protein n=1 Tax=Lutibacter sp. TH_r2 TaxID=3082083 RepID=UPI00295501B4|nr:hypothetical protein [Lutibacter sp. TH_r2]MDV7187256.1 hypothetical protein [Lutibacter sp. TH_r2]